MKIFAFDLDGTILNNEGKIQLDAIKAIRKASKDNLIVIATGRPRLHTIEATKELGCVSYVVCNNGTYVVDLKTNKTYSNGFVNKEVSRDLLEWAKINKAFYTLHTTKDSYIDKYYPDNTQPDFIHGTDYDMEAPNGRGIVHHKIEEEQITQTSIKHEINVVKKLHDEFLIKHGETHSLTIANEYYLDINPLGVSKLEGLKIISKLEKIPLSEFIAFGDSQNDLQMLQGVGKSFAMGHSLSEVKDVAHYVLGSNDSNDIAKTINELIKN